MSYTKNPHMPKVRSDAVACVKVKHWSMRKTARYFDTLEYSQVQLVGGIRKIVGLVLIQYKQRVQDQNLTLVLFRERWWKQ